MDETPEVKIPEGDPIVAPVTGVVADLTNDGLPPLAPAPIADAVTEKAAVVQEAVDALPESDGLGDLKNKELQDRCVELGLDKKGNKADLVARIRAHLSGSGPTPETPAESVTTHDLDVTDTKPDSSVTFRCNQWAGVKVFGTNIKFENHFFTTSDVGEIAYLDSWEHTERVS